MQTDVSGQTRPPFREGDWVLVTKDVVSPRLECPARLAKGSVGKVRRMVRATKSAAIGVLGPNEIWVPWESLAKLDRIE